MRNDEFLSMRFRFSDFPLKTTHPGCGKTKNCTTETRAARSHPSGGGD